jgi:hypothetical protein
MCKKRGITLLSTDKTKTPKATITSFNKINPKGEAKDVKN